MSQPTSNFIKFLGTAGARYVVARQLRSSAGTWYNFDGVNILVDPGPGTLVRCFSSRPPLDPATLQAIVLTHCHIDHSTDMNVLIEAMTDSGHQKGKIVITTAEAIGREPVIFSYVRDYLGKLELMNAGAEFEIAPTIRMITPIAHRHTAETYGLKFQLPWGVVSHIVDTSYFEELAAAYAGSDVLIMNVVRLENKSDREKGILHLTVADADKIIQAVQPKAAIITHFGMTMVRAKPWIVAQKLSETSGVPVIAASDGMAFDLTPYMLQLGR
ncbi:MAG: MBL fold metallo-hydrolase [candidate division KSB1 bacterium]|nr:MBL fold metallo-hydrolase [candidate division KSB1 bacterium]MDZ7318340.1 MBL fold metallo-hydrolase [candidate division KSB1 bacterium]